MIEFAVMLEMFFEKAINFLPQLIKAILLLLVFILISRVASAGAKKFLETRLRPGIVETLVRIIAYTFIFTGIAIAGESIGIHFGSLIALAGGLGLMVGLALSPFMKNIISGLILLWDKHFKIGDMVDVDGFFGKVESISLRETHIVTPAGVEISLPNGTVLDGAVENYSKNPRVLVAAFTITPEVNDIKGLLNTIAAEVVERVAEVSTAWARFLSSDEVKCEVQIVSKITLTPKRSEPDILSSIMLIIHSYCDTHNIAASRPEKINVIR